jgi:hypothetical protein
MYSGMWSPCSSLWRCMAASAVACREGRGESGSHGGAAISLMENHGCCSPVGVKLHTPRRCFTKKWMCTLRYLEPGEAHRLPGEGLDLNECLLPTQA